MGKMVQDLCLAGRRESILKQQVGERERECVQLRQDTSRKSERIQELEGRGDEVAAALTAARQREAEVLARVERERHTVARLLLDQLSSGRVDLSLLEIYVERYGDICDEGETYMPQSVEGESESESETFADLPQAWTEEQYQAFYQDCSDEELVDAIKECRKNGGKMVTLDRIVIEMGEVQRLIDTLAILPGLKKLRYTSRLPGDGNTISRAVGEMLPQMPQLKELSFRSRSGDGWAVTMSLPHMKHIEKVSLDISGISPESAHHLGFELGKLRRLRKVDLAYDGSDTKGVLAAVLAPLKNIQQLQWESHGLGKYGPAKLAPVLERLTNLNMLRLTDITIPTARGYAALLPVFTRLSGLQEADLMFDRSHHRHDRPLWSLDLDPMLDANTPEAREREAGKVMAHIAELNLEEKHRFDELREARRLLGEEGERKKQERERERE
ncbi:hypothetical protein KIPB_006879 [Kipferlia bialata]|uniref:Uncharacterized protein n=1 Tax=Kipferlia bialata TaxID=797122 RepID=A0A391P3H2_9EUKA|nr:hypothetical protein KIPB_006879 [Kipferlia bialata]|eukprot:g6879.t1